MTSILKVAFRGFLTLLALSLCFFGGWLIIATFLAYGRDFLDRDIEGIAWCIFALAFGLPALGFSYYLFRRLSK